MVARRGRWPFGSPFGDDDFFSDFESSFGFGQIDELMGKLMEDMAKRQKNVRPGEPLVYGVNIRVGSDGKPHVQQFGNVAKGEIREQREPLVDVINEHKEIRVIAELPGVEKHNIKLKTMAETLSITVSDPHHKFAKTLKLPEPVIEDSAKATYKNGILEVVIQKRKATEKKGEGKAIKIV